VDDSPLGTVSLQGSASLVFRISQWKGRQYADVRKFYATAKYSGPTKSGLAMTGDILVGVIKALHQLQSELPGPQEQEFARVSKRGEVDIVIKTIPPDDLKSLPSVDVREYLDTPEYTGPTKKGIRFPWDKLPEIISLLEIQAQRLEIQQPPEPTPSKLKPESAEKSSSPDQSKTKGRDAILAEIIPEGPKNFPGEFLTSSQRGEQVIELPSEPIEVAQQADGKYVVRSDFGFCCAVRNVAEGNFILYSYLRGHRTVHVPREMIVVFKAVKAYENYLRELKHTLVQAYERKSGHRPMAEHQAREIFRSFGLPWIGQS
jgi:Transcriptional Coactivator p15 (PC4)